MMSYYRLLVIILLVLSSHFAYNVFDFSTEQELMLHNSVTQQQLLATAGQFIGQFKFFGVDERDKVKVRTLMSNFPKYPLNRIDGEVKKACADNSLPFCLQLLYAVARTLQNKSSVFTPMENFNFRLSAMYYLCYKTMMMEPALSNITRCQVKNEQNELIVDTQDYRDNNPRPYLCALHLFCPDPCCGDLEMSTRMRGFSISPRQCMLAPSNPCREAPTEDMSAMECFIEPRSNRDFASLVLGKLNATCDCSWKKGGYKWNADAKMCVDIDECAEGTNDCGKMYPNSVCRNEPGDYYCTCKFGYKLDKQTKSCVPDPEFHIDDLIEAPQPEADSASYSDLMVQSAKWLLTDSSPSILSRRHGSLAMSVALVVCFAVSASELNISS